MDCEEGSSSEALLVNLGILLPSDAHFWDVWECLVNRRERSWKSPLDSDVHGNMKRESFLGLIKVIIQHYA